MKINKIYSNPKQAVLPMLIQDSQIHPGRRYIWYHKKRPLVQKDCPKRNKICIAWSISGFYQTHSL